MKRHLLTIISSFSITACALAQPVLQANDINYIAGENYTLHLCDWESAGPSGANQTWDFSGVSSNSTADINLLDASSTPAGSSFPNANIAAYVAAQGSYQYFSSTANGVEYHGLSANGTDISYSNAETFYTFPLTYSYSNTDNFSSTFMSGGYTWNRTGDITVSADGYGTLITPLGTFTDVLRVKIEEDYDDDPVGLPQVQTTTTEVYHWYKAGIHYPIVVNTTFISGGFPSYLLQYADVTTGIEDLDEISVAIYPNPTSDYLNVAGEEFINATYEIVNAQGQIVLGGVLTSGRLDVSKLSRGVYLLRVTTTSDKSGISRFQVNR